jgi:hypothetical protein
MHGMTSKGWLLLATVATASCTLLGCAADSAADPESTDDALHARSNAQIAFQYFVGKGLTRVQAAGIVGNLVQESGVDPDAMQPGGKGRGIAEWSVGERWDGPGEDSLRSFAPRDARSMHELQVQLDFIWFELQNYDHYVLAPLRSASTVIPAVLAFQRDFELCGDCESTHRVAYARYALATY